jgi:ubiquinone/menaquinone biosynthesis C-methylase UbiE
MAQSARTYLPAAGRDWSLPLYDPFLKLMGGEKAHTKLIEQAALAPGQRVLDVGCGTGTLATRIKRENPEIEVIGLDPDPKALARARRKAGRVGVAVQFDQGFGDELPYQAASFDRVFSSFMFHHVPPEEKGKMLGGIRRVLKPGGTLHLLDFEGPEDSKPGLLTRLIHLHQHLKDNSEKKILGLLNEAGFKDSQKTCREKMFLGAIAYYRARS